MVEDYEWEEFAQMSVDFSNQFLDYEKGEIRDIHDLHAEFHNWSYILRHNDEIIPDDLKHVRELNDGLMDIYEEFEIILDNDYMFGISFEKEDEKIIALLKRDLAHKEWKLVRKLTNKEAITEKKALRLEKRDFKKIHNIIRKIISLLNQSHVRQLVETDLHTTRQIHEYEERFNGYFVHMHKQFSLYERILRSLYKKEIHVFDELKYQIKKYD